MILNIRDIDLKCHITLPKIGLPKIKTLTPPMAAFEDMARRRRTHMARSTRVRLDAQHCTRQRFATRRRVLLLVSAIERATWVGRVAIRYTNQRNWRQQHRRKDATSDAGRSDSVAANSERNTCAYGALPAAVDSASRSTLDSLNGFRVISTCTSISTSTINIRWVARFEWLTAQ